MTPRVRVGLRGRVRGRAWDGLGVGVGSWPWVTPAAAGKVASSAVRDAWGRVRGRDRVRVRVGVGVRVKVRVRARVRAAQ